MYDMVLKAVYNNRNLIRPKLTHVDLGHFHTC
jgi:hypothetical protein